MLTSGSIASELHRALSGLAHTSWTSSWRICGCLTGTIWHKILNSASGEIVHLLLFPQAKYGASLVFWINYSWTVKKLLKYILIPYLSACLVKAWFGVCVVLCRHYDLIRVFHTPVCNEAQSCRIYSDKMYMGRHWAKCWWRKESKERCGPGTVLPAQGWHDWRLALTCTGAAFKKIQATSEGGAGFVGASIGDLEPKCRYSKLNMLAWVPTI